MRKQKLTSSNATERSYLRNVHRKTFGSGLMSLTSSVAGRMAVISTTGSKPNRKSPEL